MHARLPFEPTSPTAELWRRRGRLLLPGGVLAVLGALTLLVAAASPFFTGGVLGWILVAAGAVEALHGLRFWRSRWAALAPSLVDGVLYLSCGVLLLAGHPAPVAGITLLLAVVMTAGGALRMLWSLRATVPGRRITAAHGAVTLLLGLGLCAVWPVNSVSLIGLFVGADLVCTGTLLLFLAWVAQRFSPRGA